MKTKSCGKRIHPGRGLSRLRLAAAGTLILAAAALTAASLTPPTIPWAVPTITVGNLPQSAVVDPGTDTVWVTNFIDNTVSVIDGSKCNATKTSRCSPIATMINVGFGPLFIIFDGTTGSLYVANFLTATGNPGNTITVLNGKTCNAKKTIGCGQAPAATVTVPGLVGGIAVDTSDHTLYVGDANEGPVVMVNTSTCNALTTSGCNQTPATMANGDAFPGAAIDFSNHSVYVANLGNGTVSVFNGATCNATTQSNCTAFPLTLPGGFLLFPGYGFDQTTHTLYVPGGPPTFSFGSIAVVDGSTCNGTVHSGCGQTPHLVQLDEEFPDQVIIDPTTETVYVPSEDDSMMAIINAATCNGTNQSGCSQRPPRLAAGLNGIFADINLNTHTIYYPSQDTNTVWVLDASTCNATNTSGCTFFETETIVGARAIGVAENPNTKTVYSTGADDNTVSVIDATLCNKNNLSGCNQSWPTINAGNFPFFVGVNKVTNTIYVSNLADNTLSVINGATCNRTTTSGCMGAQPTTRVGNAPLQIAVDEATNTIYVENAADGTVSVINGALCNANNLPGCNRVWPTVKVGNSPQGLGLNPNNHTVYVANTNDNTVSVINGNTCNGTTSSGCHKTPAKITVGNAPRSVGVVTATNTVFVGNRDDLTVSVIDGSTCNGTNASGCGQTPPAVLVGAFPSTAGNDTNILGRGIGVDSTKHIVYIPTFGDSDVATLDATTCHAGNISGCSVTIVPGRMGGHPELAIVDESSGTVYVSNANDGTVSVFGE